MFSTYVLYSELHDKIYIGFTSNVQQRILAHNDDKNSGWSRSFRPWKLIYFEEFESKSEAMAREKQLKSAKGRAFIRERIAGGF